MIEPTLGSLKWVILGSLMLTGVGAGCGTGHVLDFPSPDHRQDTPAPPQEPAHPPGPVSGGGSQPPPVIPSQPDTPPASTGPGPGVQPPPQPLPGGSPQPAPQPTPLPDPGASDVFFEDFKGPLDPHIWKLAKRDWGPQGSGANSYNSGFRPDNMSLDGDHALMQVRGDQYPAGPVGIPEKAAGAMGIHTGAALATQAYFGSGRYEVRMKVAPKLGAASMFWTLNRHQGSPFKSSDGGGGTQEIQYGFPGRTSPSSQDFSFSRAALGTWEGEQPDQFSVTFADIGAPQDDGQFHVYRFDWHTGSSSEKMRVEYYVDGKRIATHTEHVPTVAGRFWIGAWSPENWAGIPAFSTVSMGVDWVRITPFHEPGDQHMEETSPEDGWASVDEFPQVAKPNTPNG